jgi:hypothetical protein
MSVKNTVAALMPRGLPVSAPAFLEIAGEAWLCVLQDADGNEETELITIERAGDGAPVIELTTGVRITCTQASTLSSTGPKSAAA